MCLVIKLKIIQWKDISYIEKAVDISMGSNYVPFPADMLLYLYELGNIQGLQKSRYFIFTIHNIADVFSLNNFKLYD
jgi:hypothetical protein